MILLVGQGAQNWGITEDNIRDITIDYKIDEMAATLPMDEMHAIVRIPKEKAGIFRYNTEIMVTGGTKIWGKFYTRECKEAGKNTYSIYAVSIIGILAERNFPGKMFIKSVGKYNFGEALAKIVGGTFSDTKVTVDNTYFEFEDICWNFDVEGWIGHCSQREAIRHLCLACGVVAFTNNSGRLCFRRAFGDEYVSEANNHSYQQDEVFDNYSISEGVRYSHYACDIYRFSTNSNVSDQYVYDIDTNTEYYYTTEKAIERNLDFPEGSPQNEIYIQGEMLISSINTAAQVLYNLDKYYKGATKLEFTAVTDNVYKHGVGFFDGEKMIFGYPSAISVGFGRQNVIKYTCEMAYTQDAHPITINYKNTAGDLLAQKTIYKGSEEQLTVKNPVITLKVDHRHKVIYLAENKETTIEDPYGEVTEVDETCVPAIIQDGNMLEVYNVDSAVKTLNTLAIGGKISG